MVSYLCQIAKVSRSGYYNYFASQSQEHRFQRDKKDELIRDNILKAYNFKGLKKGCRFYNIVICHNYYILIISFAKRKEQRTTGRCQNTMWKAATRQS